MERGSADNPDAGDGGDPVARVHRVYDVGVAVLHRLLRQSSAVVASAGMEGALASVVGGPVDTPVSGVPTSVGYEASFGGLAALLGILNSCATGVTVVNIDNGFGVDYFAALLALRAGRSPLSPAKEPSPLLDVPSRSATADSRPAVNRGAGSPATRDTPGVRE